MKAHDYEAALAAGRSQPPGLTNQVRTQVEAEFRAWYFGSQMARARGSLLLAQLLVFASVAADLYEAQDNPQRFAAIAKLLLISPLLFATQWIAGKPDLRQWFPYSMCASIVAVGLAFALIDVGSSGSAVRFDAIVLVTAFTYFLGGLASNAASATGLALIGLHIFLSSTRNLPLDTLAYQSLILLAINALGMVSANQNEQHVRDAFWRFHAMAQLSEMDPLTSLLNRRGFDRAYAELWDKAMREKQPLALAIVDLDHFKAINDNFGHEVGDDTLKQLAKVLSQAESPALCARMGGDEFVVAWYGVSGTRAELVAGRIPETFEQLGLRNEASPTGHATVSVGLSIHQPVAGDLAGDFVRRADRAVYAAKEAGRNRIAVV